MPLTELEAAWRLAIAGLIGLGVGVEREWSGHAAGPDARFAGMRTFLLMGIVGGTAGLLLAQSHTAAGAAIAAAGMALAVGAYVMAVRGRSADLDGTTEASALVVVALGVLAGTGWLALAAGVGSIVVLALREKTRLHWLVRRVDEVELRAALQFAALALVVLPLLPEGPFFGNLAVRPRALWIVVLIFSGLNFAGYIARRAVGAAAGYSITGALGGLVSSTAVTLTFSRHSRAEPALGTSLASGVIGACTVLILRVLVVSAAIRSTVAVALLPLLLPQLAIGLGAVVWAARSEPTHGVDGPKEQASPLRLWTAIRMAAAFQIAVSLLMLARDWWGTLGVYTTGAVMGLTDMDALTYSMSRPESGIDAGVAARVIAIGIVANSALKLGLSLALGAGRFRVVASTGLVALAAAGLLALWIA